MNLVVPPTIGGAAGYLVTAAASDSILPGTATIVAALITTFGGYYLARQSRRHQRLERKVKTVEPIAVRAERKARIADSRSTEARVASEETAHKTDEIAAKMREIQDSYEALSRAQNEHIKRLTDELKRRDVKASPKNP